MSYEIYDLINPDVAIRQGDIFIDLPFTQIDLNELILLSDIENVKTWEEVKNRTEIIAGVKLTKVNAIVISQDCDALRNDYISLAKIDTLPIVTNRLPGKDPLPSNVNKLTEFITRGPAKYGYKWFYLPQSEMVGFSERMAADFDTIFQLPADNLHTRLQDLRKGRLNNTAIEHFKDSLAKYFTRFSYNEWYSFTPSEFKAYKDKAFLEEQTNIKPYPGQEE